jgi:hypothetical protein
MCGVLDISENVVELITCRSRWLCYKLDNVVVSDEILNIHKGDLGITWYIKCYFLQKSKIH